MTPQSRAYLHAPWCAASFGSGTAVVILFTAEVFNIIAALSLTGQSYADDTPVYISAPVTESQPASARLTECVE